MAAARTDKGKKSGSAKANLSLKKDAADKVKGGMAGRPTS
jgi:hypothetical protein